ncbi:MAG: bifunctional [glutamine synthetase] adenylyltransferase/[glutamine synthetase]-adenylyl-L-tyrosine phosphorylase, partial [Phenylobacterium sp.]
MRLVDQMKPCGPVADEKAAERASNVVAEALGPELLETAWPALAPIFGASPYLVSLARRDPRRLAELLAGDPDARLGDILGRTAAAAALDGDAATVTLRKLKAELHLLTALADLGGVWDLDQVTGALTRFA